MTYSLTRSWRVLLGALFACASFVILSQAAYAADRYYVGGNYGDSTSWNTTNPGACNPGGGDAGAAPTSVDTVIFDADCDTSVTIPTGSTMAVLDLSSGYTGTVTIATGGVVSVLGPITIGTGSTLAGADSAASLRLQGNFTNSGTYTSNGNTLTFYGAGTQSFNPGSSSFTGVRSSNTGTILSLSTNPLTATTITVDSGAFFYLNGQSLTATTVNNDGTLRLAGSETITVTTASGAGTTLYNGTDTYASVTPFPSYNDLTFNGSGGSWTFNAALDVNGSFTVTAGTVALGSNGVTVAGNWTNAGSVTTSGTVTFDGGAAQTLITGGTGPGNDFQNLTVSGASTAVTLDTNNLDIDGTLTINNASGSLDVVGLNLTAATLSNTGTLKLNGVDGQTVTIGTMDTDSGTVTYQGASGTNSYTGLTIGDSYYNLTINATSDTYTLDAALDVDGALTLSAGTLVAGTYGIDVAGNFTRNMGIGGGAFTPSTGTVTFSGSGNHTVDGAISFYNLTKTGSGTISFAMTQGFEVTGTLTSTGTNSTMNSTVPGSTVTVVITAAVVNSLTVRDITNTGNTVRCYPSCTNGGNNTGWLFTAASSTVTTGGGGSSAPNTLALTSPNGGNTLTGGQTTSITWQTSGAGITSISLEYSTNGGNTYTTIATGEANDGSYTWTVPNISTSMAKVQVKAYSGPTLSMTDISDANFTIAASTTAPTTTDTTSTTQQNTGTGPTVVTMTKSDGASVNLSSGGLFRGVTLSGLYRVNADGTRSVFPNEAAFMSYEKDWSNVVTVNDDQLRKLPLGKRITMNKGSLVKIQTDPKVYVVGDNAKLTWIPSEAEATLQFGANWAKQVRDVSDAFWFDYTR
jgi:hypothetical protein